MNFGSSFLSTQQCGCGIGCNCSALCGCKAGLACTEPCNAPSHAVGRVGFSPFTGLPVAHCPYLNQLKHHMHPHQRTLDNPMTHCKWCFLMDIESNDNEYLVKCELPGVPKENIDVSFNNGYLHIKAKKDIPSIQHNLNKDVILSEIEGGLSHRSYAIPANANVDASQVVLQNGVLMLRIPKTAAAALAVKKIAIN